MAAWPIDWHERNLANYRESFAKKQAEADRLVGELVRWEAEIKFRQAQIDAAKKAGKKAFDPDKFMKRRDAASRSET